MAPHGLRRPFWTSRGSVALGVAVVLLLPGLQQGELFPDYDCEYAPDMTGELRWNEWRRIFETGGMIAWGDLSDPYLEAFMAADSATKAGWYYDCPLGALQANVMVYVYSLFRGEQAVAMPYAMEAQQVLAQFDLHVVTGSRWPIFSLLTTDRLMDPEVRLERITGNSQLNCDTLAEPLLNWQRFRSIFDSPDVRQGWFHDSIRYVFSWQMEQLPGDLAKECPVGFLTANLVKAFTCATSESSCYASHAHMVEEWFREEPQALLVLAHGRWPLALLLNHMARGARHRFQLDFHEAELIGDIPALAGPRGSFASWAGQLAEAGHSQSFRDLMAAVLHLGPPLPGAPTLAYITMVYGAQFNRHIRRFCARARAVGVGHRLLLFTLDEGAYRECLVENELRCIRGSPSIMNKFTLPLMCAHLGLDTMWIDLDVFLMADPTPALIAHADLGQGGVAAIAEELPRPPPKEGSHPEPELPPVPRGSGPPYDILISGSYEADCICNGLVYFRATAEVRIWLLAVLEWMYNHPYEHDQKTFSAFLHYTERVTSTPLPNPPPVPPWDILDPINAFVTPDTYEGNGWAGELDGILIYHFLNGDSDTGSDLDPSGSWMRDHGHFADSDEVAPGMEQSIRPAPGGRISLMDLFYGQADEELYTTAKPAYASPALRRALLSARKTTRRRDLLGKPCGPMVGVVR